MPSDAVVVGAGIGGLVAALSLHELGLSVTVVESVEEIRPLGVGINLQPHAVRELDELGLLTEPNAIAIAPAALHYFSKHGQPIWSEARGTAAGYRWPQLSVHRGRLQLMLLDAVHQRLGSDSVLTGHEAVSFESSRVVTRRRRDGARVELEAPILIGADGIHSAVRRQLHPGEGAPSWNGSVMWRGISVTDPILDGRTMVWAGHPRQKLVAYPIEDLPDGRQVVNVIAELKRDEVRPDQEQDWNRPGRLEDVLPAFADWVFDWLDCPALIRGAEALYVYPMVDRDPLDTWTSGPVTLLGDAAHPMYPIGFNGASQAILDARVLAGCVRSRPDDPLEALRIYEEVRRPAARSRRRTG